jgi:hypothetical protein
MAKRASLSTFQPTPFPAATEGRVTAIAPKASESALGGRKKYPHVSVYLPASTIRTLKLIAIEHDRRLNDICAEAVQEWLERNGHARSETYKA